MERDARARSEPREPRAIAQFTLVLPHVATQYAFSELSNTRSPNYSRPLQAGMRTPVGCIKPHADTRTCAQRRRPLHCVIACEGAAGILCDPGGTPKRTGAPWAEHAAACVARPGG